MNNIIQIVLYVGAAQGFLLAAGLLTIGTNKNSNRILSMLTFIWAVVLLVYALQEDNFYINNPHLLLVFDQLILLIFPLFFLYAKYLLSNEERYSLKDLWHFLPFAASILAHSGFFLKTAEEKVDLILNPNPYMDWLEIISNEVVSIQSILYSTLVLILVHRYKKAHKDQTSMLIQRRINFLQVGALVVLLFWSVSIICLHLSLFGVNIAFDFYAVSYLSLVLLIYIISYVSFKNTEVFKVEFASKSSQSVKKSITTSSELEQVEKGETASQPSAASNDHFLKLNQRLIDAMEKEKLYLKPELSLRDLTDHLGASRNELSTIINSYQKKNFYEFVNQYRVDEVIAMMKNPKTKNLTVEGLGYSAGFNSKASFYRIFKQFTKKSPSQYLKELETGA